MRAAWPPGQRRWIYLTMRNWSEIHARLRGRKIADKFQVMCKRGGDIDGNRCVAAQSAATRMAKSRRVERPQPVS